MIIVNFGHPLTAEQLGQVEVLTGEAVQRVIDVKMDLDLDLPFQPQIQALVDGVGLSVVEWQTLPLLVNPPGLHVAALTLLAELNGRMGYFPAILRLKPISDSAAPRFGVAEVINLQAVRDQARKLRSREGPDRQSQA